MAALVVQNADRTTQPLSVLLRDGSRAEHEAAEGSRFMAELLDGRINARGYAEYLTRFARVYAALESVGRSLADDALAGAVLDPVLERLPSIEADLEYWRGYASPTGQSPATDAYVDRIEESSGWGGLYVAHHYTRYLGDLSGGQAMGRILARAFALTDGAGVAFYDFSGIPKPKPYKDAYRARLDALPLDADGKQRVLDEVKVVFELNSAIFTELGQNLDDYHRSS